MEKAAALRLRSILMTTIATVIGLVPLLLASSGPGANSHASDTQAFFYECALRPLIMEFSRL